MTDTTPLLQIVQHLPRWLLPLAGVLAAVGLAQALPRQVGIRRALMPSLVLAGLSLHAALTVLGIAGLLGWLVGAGLAFATGAARRDLQGARYDAQQRRYALPGSLWPLGLIAVVFTLRVVLGVVGALHADALHSLGIEAIAGAIGGAASGCFLGRAHTLWQLARRATLVRALA